MREAILLISYYVNEKTEIPEVIQVGNNGARI